MPSTLPASVIFVDEKANENGTKKTKSLTKTKLKMTQNKMKLK